MVQNIKSIDEAPGLPFAPGWPAEGPGAAALTLPYHEDDGGRGRVRLIVSVRQVERSTDAEQE